VASRDLVSPEILPPESYLRNTQSALNELESSPGFGERGRFPGDSPCLQPSEMADVKCGRTLPGLAKILDVAKCWEVIGSLEL